MTDQSCAHPAEKGNMARLGLKIYPKEAHAAVAVLEEFIRERVKLTEERHRLADTVEAVRLMDAFKRFTEDLADRVKSPAEKAYDKMRFTVVPAFMEDAGITNITVEDVGRVNITDDISVKVEDKEGLREWLVEHEREDLITESVNAQTLAAFIRAQMRESAKSKIPPIIPGEHIVTVTPVTRAQIAKTTK